MGDILEQTRAQPRCYQCLVEFARWPAKNPRFCRVECAASAALMLVVGLEWCPTCQLWLENPPSCHSSDPEPVQAPRSRFASQSEEAP
jgi:hypothetical protein